MRGDVATGLRLAPFYGERCAMSWKKHSHLLLATPPINACLHPSPPTALMKSRVNSTVAVLCCASARVASNTERYCCIADDKPLACHLSSMRCTGQCQWPMRTVDCGVDGSFAALLAPLPTTAHLPHCLDRLHTVRGCNAQITHPLTVHCVDRQQLVQLLLAQIDSNLHAKGAITTNQASCGPIFRWSVRCGRSFNLTIVLRKRAAASASLSPGTLLVAINRCSMSGLWCSSIEFSSEK